MDFVVEILVKLKTFNERENGEDEECYECQQCGWKGLLCVWGGGGISLLISFRSAHLKYIYMLSILNIRINVVNIQKYTTHNLILHFLNTINWDRFTFIYKATMPQPQTGFHDYFVIVSLHL